MKTGVTYIDLSQCSFGVSPTISLPTKRHYYKIDLAEVLPKNAKISIAQISSNNEIIYENPNMTAECREKIKKLQLERNS